MLLKLYWSLVRPPWIPISKITQRSQPENQSSLLTPPLHLFLVLSTTLLRLAKFSPNIILSIFTFFSRFSYEIISHENKCNILIVLLHPLLPSSIISFTNLKSYHPYTFTSLLFAMWIWKNDNLSALWALWTDPFLLIPSILCLLFALQPQWVPFRS